MQYWLKNNSPNQALFKHSQYTNRHKNEERKPAKAHFIFCKMATNFMYNSGALRTVWAYEIHSNAAFLTLYL